jgi:hypothetical protein
MRVLIRLLVRTCPGDFQDRPAARDQRNFDQSGGRPMFDFKDLFQWDRFITPTIIKTFYWLVIGLIVLFGIAGVFEGLSKMAISPFGGFIVLLSAIASVVVAWCSRASPPSSS